ncbi:hypothetical protein B0H34DRAFT_792324 [Crassisporium funariophilum]|nr:hypothetical protein B0H34DRAFT_792324 [Crassisporium funariophilum]
MLEPMDNTTVSAGLGIDLYPADTLSDFESSGSLVSDSVAMGPQITPTPERSGDPLEKIDYLELYGNYIESQKLQAAVLDSKTSTGTSLRAVQQVPSDPCLTRHGTLLSTDVNPSRTAAELKTILGDATSRLKSGATLFTPETEEVDEGNKILLEQAKSRSRVELDIVLESNICVQGGYLRGHVHVRIKERLKKEGPVLLSGGKIRVVGFECILNERERFTFYQCAAPLAEIAPDIDRIYTSGRDSEGFSRATEGLYVFPFVLHLPMSSDLGQPKGQMKAQAGISDRSSLRVKDSGSHRKSIAHFYRDCSIWPRLNPSTVLAPTPRPLQMTASEDLRGDGIGRVHLTASLHRLYWIAGQLCYVKINVINESRKDLKTLTLALIRHTNIFKPKVHLDALPSFPCNGAERDAWETTTTTKQVAESTLVMGERGSRGHASAKGWWAGVRALESVAFSHHILLPTDALSIMRGKLLEVLYTIRVTISAGTLLSTDVNLSLPVQIVNFLSIDPPPTSPEMPLTRHGRPLSAHENLISGSDFVAQSDKSFTEGECPVTEDHGHREDLIMDTEDHDELGTLSFHDDTDEVVQFAVASASADADYADHAPRFADLYYSSLQENLDKLAEDFYNKQAGENASRSDTAVSKTLIAGEQRAPGNFALRVAEKKLKRQVNKQESCELVLDPDGHYVANSEYPSVKLEPHLVENSPDREQLGSSERSGLQTAASSWLGSIAAESTTGSLGPAHDSSLWPSRGRPGRGDYTASTGDPADVLHSIGSQSQLESDRGASVLTSTPTKLHSRILPSSPSEFAAAPVDVPQKMDLTSTCSSFYSTANSTSTATSSVKDKIRELEERVASLEGQH